MNAFIWTHRHSTGGGRPSGTCTHTHIYIWTNTHTRRHIVMIHQYICSVQRRAEYSLSINYLICEYTGQDSFNLTYVFSSNNLWCCCSSPSWTKSHSNSQSPPVNNRKMLLGSRDTSWSRWSVCPLRWPTVAIIWTRCCWTFLTPTRQTGPRGSGTVTTATSEVYQCIAATE